MWTIKQSLELWALKQEGWWKSEPSLSYIVIPRSAKAERHSTGWKGKKKSFETLGSELFHLSPELKFLWECPMFWYRHLNTQQRDPNQCLFLLYSKHPRTVTFNCNTRTVTEKKDEISLKPLVSRCRWTSAKVGGSRCLS